MLWFLAFLRRLLWPFGRRSSRQKYPIFEKSPFRDGRNMTGRGIVTHHSRSLKKVRKASRIHYQGQGHRGPGRA